MSADGASYKAPTRALASGLCNGNNKAVAMLPWKLKPPLAVADSISHLTCGVARAAGSAQRETR
eukprot:9470984-Pyramimonas_sp.AAC.2